MNTPNNKNIDAVENEYRYIVTAYYEALGEHDACMYMASIELTEAQRKEAYKGLGSGKCPNEIANDIFNEDFLY